MLRIVVHGHVPRQGRLALRIRSHHLADVAFAASERALGLAQSACLAEVCLQELVLGETRLFFQIGHVPASKLVDLSDRL